MDFILFHNIPVKLRSTSTVCFSSDKRLPVCYTVVTFIFSRLSVGAKQKKKKHSVDPPFLLLLLLLYACCDMGRLAFFFLFFSCLKSRGRKRKLVSHVLLFFSPRIYHSHRTEQRLQDKDFLFFFVSFYFFPRPHKKKQFHLRVMSSSILFF